MIRRRTDGRPFTIWQAPDWPVRDAPEGGVAVERFQHLGGHCQYALLGGVIAYEAPPGIQVPEENEGRVMSASVCWGPGPVMLGVPDFARASLERDLAAAPVPLVITVAAHHDVHTSEMAFRLSLQMLVACFEPGVDLAEDDLWSKGRPITR